MGENNYGGFKATAALAEPYLLCKLVSGELVVTTADNDAAIGVAQNKYSAAQYVNLQLMGPAKFRASGAIAVGDELVPSDVGGDEGYVKDGTGAASETSCGLALQAQADQGEFVGLLYAYKLALT